MNKSANGAMKQITFSRPSIMNHSNRTNAPHFKELTAGILVLWFLAALGFSWFGAFASPQRPPVLLGAAATLPLVLFVVWYLRSKDFRQFLLAADLRILTLLQTARVGGILFVILYLRGVLPGIFALPAGWGDVAIGATAPLAAWAASRGRNAPRNLFLWWNVLGILDLVRAVTLGVLASGALLGSHAGAVTTEGMGKFPLSLVPTFLVPLWLILHLVVLSRIHSANSEQI
jgi:hypothetical protein